VIFKYCKKSFPCVKNTNGILKYETLIYKEISYIHVDRYSKYHAMGILKIPHTLPMICICIKCWNADDRVTFHVTDTRL
jgi:hypothetical protein